MKRKTGLIAVMLLTLTHVLPARADETSEIKRQILEQTQQLQQLRQRLDALEARQKQQSQKMEETISEAAEDQQVSALPESLRWAENVKISGDLRYRHEHIDSETGTTDVRWQNGVDRHRIWARLMFEAMVNDEWDVAFRLASGSKDPVSRNQDLQDSFSSKDFWLDLAYFHWHPIAAEGLNVVGGKVQNPLYRVGKNQLVWDDDLNPEGLAAQICTPLNDADRLFVNGGGFWVDESSSGVDTSLWAAQTYLKHKIGNSDYLLGGASYLDYGNMEGRSDLGSTWSVSDFFGNTSSGGRFVNDYDVLEAFGEYGFQCGRRPMAVFGSWVQNLAATTDEDTGWLVGAKLNKARDPGSWELSYDYRELEADAVVGAMNDSDFIGGGTNGRGHRVGGAYQLARNVQVAATYFHDEDEGGIAGRDLDYRRLQCDLKIKF
ncbi:MAG: putative porin [Phycisphaerales bacterium]|nr:MAG: putative porin [Phycisphaerales bacterium]